MELEFSIEDLLKAKRVEGNRIEFKAGWNPDDIYKSVCAWANDFDNQGGGYIVIGVEEEHGIAKRPVKGIKKETLDRIQREMVGFNKKIVPAYFPKTIIEEVDDQSIIVLWVPTGAQRPYKMAEHVTAKKEKPSKYFIRYNSSSIAASPEQEQELISMASRVPFDVQANPNATMDDISPILLERHLRATGSRLAKDVRNRGVEAVLEEMQLLEGPAECIKLKNVALMMFCEYPEKFFPYTQVEITKFPEGSIREPNNFIEIPPIKGSVPTIIRRTMEKLQDMVIEERITKVDYQMESLRRVSYPYQALEEVIVNAFYHRDYLSYEPVQIEIEPECINVISFPGIDRSIPMDVIQKGERFRTRRYRNRRLGEFLKEIDLCEGRSTGIPTIQDELSRNGSPKAVFVTDDDRQGLRVEIAIHPDFLHERIDIEEGKVDIETEKVDIETRKVDIEQLKRQYAAYLKQKGAKEPTIQNVNLLLEEFGLEYPFGRNAVADCTGLKPSSASKLIKKLADYCVIIPIEGQGKGKYIFIENETRRPYY